MSVGQAVRAAEPVAVDPRRPAAGAPRSRASWSWWRRIDADALSWLTEPVGGRHVRATARPPRRLARAGPSTRRAVRGAATLGALVPVSLIVAVRAIHALNDPVLGVYGLTVLLATMIVMYVAFAWYDDPSAGVPSLDHLPLVSCMVAVKDDVRVIERCVASLLDSSYPRLEVIVVDDCSQDGTGELLEQLARRQPFTLLRMPGNVGKKRALTFAVSRASGDVLAFTDSDCIVAPSAITQCVKAFNRCPDIGAVSGHARALNADQNFLTRIQDAWYEGQFSVAKAAESFFGSVTCVSGPLAVFRREAVYNYFPAWEGDTFLGQEFRFATDRQLTGYVLGQQWVGRQLKASYRSSPFVTGRDHPERRWRIEYVRSARVLTNVPSSLRSVLRHQVRWKKSFIRNLFFTGTFFWRRGIMPAFLYYGHVLWVLAAPVLAFRHLLWLPAHGKWLLLVLYLCGVLFKGSIWAVAYKVQNPRSHRWVYRPLMSLLSSLLLSWLLWYSAATLRKGVWARG
jgi:cellulose synthase/poly-beta-1,6-N-acetylglucosamine synthase-like glycosyltransferase